MSLDAEGQKIIMVLRRGNTFKSRHRMSKSLLLDIPEGGFGNDDVSW